MTPDVWEAEFNRDGQVVLPFRRRFLILHTCLFGFLAMTNTYSIIRTIQTDRPWGAWEISNVVFVALYAIFLSLVLWRFIRRTPKVTIDHRGVTKGWRTITWTNIDSVVYRFNDRVTLVNSGRPLRIDRLHVANRHALAWWLQTVLDRYRIR